jgi:serine/threonine protein kinase
MSAIAASVRAPMTIGRFEIERTLGKGAQGSVYLARDPHLGREVAVKAIGRGASAAKIQALLQEARVISQFSHPNIVTLYDALEHEGSHYLVLEYVPGVTLAQLIQKDGRLDKMRALRIASQIAGGLSYAHAKQVIHRDIKPANIMIDAQDCARIMDFGIAATAGAAQSGALALQGTPRYMAPERMGDNVASQAGDIFSLGMVLYEMLTGTPAVTGASVFEVMHKIANEPIHPPSRSFPEIDERLDHLVMRALLKDDGERYASAAAMKTALDGYLAPDADSEKPAEGVTGTVEFLLRRMNHKGNFPALSRTIGTINRVAANSDESVQTLSAALLKDFALTNKLLRIVNSSTYGQYGGNISTISRAVMILGFNAVRDLAVTLILFEHLQNKSQAAQLKEDVISSFFAGVMARRIAGRCGVPDSEEGFVCGVFHNLGKMLATYYFFDESAEIAKRQARGETEDKASRAVLGVSYEELGIGVARSWHLPEKIINSMQRLGAGRAPKATTTTDRLRVTTNLATALCRVASDTARSRKTAELDELKRRFGATLNLGKEQLAAVVDDSVKEFLTESAIFVADSGKSRVLKAITSWSGNGDDTPANAGDVVDVTAGAADALDALTHTATGLAGSGALDSSAGASAAATLTAGIQDLTNTLVGEYDLNDILRIILETMYRGMAFSHVLLCTRDARSNSLQARFGFGVRSDEYLKKFRVPLGQTQDVFQVALDKNVDLFIADSHAANIATRIPRWYRDVVNAPAFLLLPVVMNKKVIGLFYADHDNAGELTIDPEQLRLLKTLRNQAVLAIRQKC